jgi:hypothetical protein
MLSFTKNDHSYTLFFVIIFTIGIAVSFSSNLLFNKQNLGPSAAKVVLEQAFSDCTNVERGLFFECFAGYMRPHIRTHGISGLVTVIDQEIQQDLNSQGGSLDRCHDVVHVIGQIGASELGSQQALHECSTVCGAGCFHGVVEDFVANSGDLSQAMTSLCVSSDNEQFNRSLWACFHGLGHGVGTLVGEPIESFEMCDLAPNDLGRENCSYGVFMELFETSSFGHETLPIPTDLHAFCDSLWGIHQEVCYGYSGLLALQRDNTIDSAAVTCSQVPQEHTLSCISHLGNMAYYHYQDDLKELRQFCTQFGTEAELECTLGMLQESVNSDPQARIGFALCDSFQDNQETYLSCYKELGKRVSHFFGDEKRVELCSQVVDDGYQACISGKYGQ